MSRSLLTFFRSRRASIAILTAAAILPLTMLIALSIDYSFYAQARAQFVLAGDAAATYAIREATATYALDSASETNAVATSAAESVGNGAGTAWFNAQLATLPTASVSSGSPTVNVQANQNLSPTNPAGFTADVAYTGSYPPFFNPLFHRTSNWNIIGSSSANSSYAYVELLILMDTSSSMLVSADSSDVQTMDDNTVCVPSSEVDSNETSVATGISAYVDTSPTFVTWGNVKNLSSGTGTTAQCNHGTNGNTSTKGTTSAWAPCAFACHVTTNSYSSGGSTYYKDFYGLARQLGVKLKTDIVFSSIESMISSMQSSEQVSGQFTLGIYQFSDSACPIVDGSSSDALPEATSNLSSALTTINNDDYNQNPNETAFPLLSDTSESKTHTDFPTSVTQLISGKFACGEKNAAGTVEAAVSGTALAQPPSNASLLGTEAAYPERNIFIVTDGMEDTSGTSSCGRVEGEMAGINAEQTGSTTSCDLAICSQLKQLGFTVYVLQISYPSTQVAFYYNSNQTTSDKYVNSDFSTLSSGNGGTIQNWNEGKNLSQTTLQSPPPNQEGLEACASAPQDYYQASSSTAITTAMTQMLNSALSAAVRITE